MEIIDYFTLFFLAFILYGTEEYRDAGGAETKLLYSDHRGSRIGISHFVVGSL